MEDHIFKPGPNNVFVFGSNKGGRHSLGAAKTARMLYGAIYGVGEGLQGNSYAIPTKDANIKTLDLADIQEGVDRFIKFARNSQDLNFFVTAIGTGLAGYKACDIAPMFKDAPSNCKLPPGWRT